MLFPAVSVTVIGLVVGLIAMVATDHRPAPAIARGVAGAWLGFAAGALAGVAIDVVLGDGIFVAIVGHALAVAGAIVALRRFPRSAGA